MAFVQKKKKIKIDGNRFVQRLSENSFQFQKWADFIALF